MNRNPHPPRRRRSRLQRALARRPKPVWLVVTLHALSLVVALILFALPHHVISYDLTPSGEVSMRPSAAAQTQNSDPTPEALAATEPPAVEAGTAAPMADVTPSPTDAVGSFSVKYVDKFTDGDPVITENSYVGRNVNVTLTRYDEGGVVFYLSDIYVRDISCFQTPFAKDKYARNATEDILTVARRVQSITTLSGDYYGVRTGGVCIRNGVLYRSGDIARDICVLYWDGSVKCFSKRAFDCDSEMAAGAYQAWNFGPALLNEDGSPRDSFESIYDDISGRNPRAAFGYYEPGHYCFVAVDGRSSSSAGLSLKNLALLMNKLGCVQAYNMDGGQTAKLAYGPKLVNNPSSGGRDCSDYLAIIDAVA